MPVHSLSFVPSYLLSPIAKETAHRLALSRVELVNGILKERGIETVSLLVAANRTLSAMVRDTAVGVGGHRFETRTVKLDTMSPTARHRYGAVLPLR